MGCLVVRLPWVLSMLDARPRWTLTPTGPPKHVVVVPIDAAVAESEKLEEFLRISLATDSPVRSVLLRYDFSPAKSLPRSAEIAEGKLFVGGSYVAFVGLRQDANANANIPSIN